MKRYNFIGGSDAPDIFNLAPYGCQRRCWYEKTGQAPDFPLQENFHMRRGVILEPLVKKLYKQKTKRTLTTLPMIAYEKYPFIAGHVDAIIKKDNAPLEIKCPSLQNLKKIQREGIPKSYILQLQHYIGLTNADYGSYAIFNVDADLLKFDVPRDQRLISEIVEAEVEFWEKVQSLLIPDKLPVDDRRCQTCNWRISCQGILLTLPANADAVPRPDLAWLIEEYHLAKSILDDAEAFADDIKNQIKEKLGDTQIAETETAKIYYKQIESWRWNVHKLEADHPELIQAYKQKSVSRTLRIFENG